jgi:hypothetical protein
LFAIDNNHTKLERGELGKKERWTKKNEFTKWIGKLPFNLILCHRALGFQWWHHKICGTKCTYITSKQDICICSIIYKYTWREVKPIHKWNACSISAFYEEEKRKWEVFESILNGKIEWKNIFWLIERMWCNDRLRSFYTLRAGLKNLDFGNFL